ncbi:MAG: DUF814 domain-containing protein [Gemmatimonadetes bacterium]|nr:DUF814 domain-containing protein [Gemmatimonadota bacterium]
MSKGIRFDALLVRYLADELDRRLRGRRVSALWFQGRAARVWLILADEALLWELAPARGFVRLLPAPDAPTLARLPHGTVLRRVHAPADERVLRCELGGPHAARTLVLELLTNQWNALLLGEDGRIRQVLRARNAGARVLRRGVRYAEPPPAGRIGVQQPIERAAWLGLLGAVAPAERARVVIERLAWLSPQNVRAVLGEAAQVEDAGALEAAYERYRALASLPEPRPRVLEPEHDPRPYPVPLPGIPDRPVPTLLAAMDAVAGVGAEPAPSLPPELLERLRWRIRHAEARLRRLADQAARAQPEAESLRRRADLLLSQLHRVARGAARAELSDFEGGTVTVELDPTRTPAQNAQQWYDAARKRERAAARLPVLRSAAGADKDRLVALLGRAERGDVTAAELDAVLGPAAAPRHAPEARLPYRRYRTSSGLEVRVGKSSRANDELTFRHAAPTDIWLHARDVAGAHVVLRWPRATAGPPARDLTEAAVLAALHSRARSAGVVPVDWTRRKYVRKPRKAAPGAVIPERVQTMFVEPDGELERRLRFDPEDQAQAESD